MAVGALQPHDALLPWRAERVCGVPVDDALGRREAVGGRLLPTLVGPHRPQQVSTMRGPPRQAVGGGDRAHIDALVPRGELAGSQRRLHRGQPGKIGGCGRGGRHSGAQGGRLVVTGVGDGHLVARPFRCALFARAGFRGRGGADQQRRRGQSLRAAPAHRLALGGRRALLQPHRPQGLEGGPLPQPGGRGRLVDGPQP
jgi:hypothetical protein